MIALLRGYEWKAGMGEFTVIKLELLICNSEDVLDGLRQMRVGALIDLRTPEGTLFPSGVPEPPAQTEEVPIKLLRQFNFE